MIRGDSANINIKIRIKDTEEYIDGSQYSEVEVQFNPQGSYFDIKKLKSKNEISWEEDHFEVHLTQEETFKLNDGQIKIQVRLFKEDICRATLISDYYIGSALSNQIIGGTE